MININKVLLEFVKNRATLDIHTQLPEETPEEPKPSNQKAKSEEVQKSNSKPLRKKKGKVNPSNNLSGFVELI